MKSSFFTIAILLAVISLSACSSSPDVQRVDSGSQIDLSGY